jgi:hypothetical protein
MRTSIKKPMGEMGLVKQKDKTNFRVKVIRSHSFRVSACTQ